MNIRGIIVGEEFDDTLLADITVTSDSAESWQDTGFKRKITGTIDRRGKAWDRVVGFWADLNVAPYEEDGRQYFFVKGIEVEYDFYPFHSWMSVNGNEMSLIVSETFQGSVEDYYKTVAARNKKIAKHIEMVNGVLSGRVTITMNDYREYAGFGRRDEPFLNRPMDINTARKLLEGTLDNFQETRNTII